ncbi:MAG: serine hydrolase domain-containing protein, partial [Pseudomonadota bacterium]
MTRNFFLSAAAILPLTLMACGNSATNTAGQDNATRQLMQASPANDLEQALINGLSAEYPEDKPGIVVTVTKGDEVAAEIALGKANWEFDIDWTVDTTNTLYSTTKSMVVMALLELQRQGQLDMNDSVTDYLDDFPTYDHDITLAHLASHTSGLYEDEVLIPLLGVGLSDIPLTLDEMYELVLNQSVLSHQPGTYFSYSDTAMRVLARVIEKISGQSFSEAMDTLLFTPANMDTAYISAREPVRSKGRASSYYPEPMENRDETKEAYKILGTLVESSGDGAAVGTIQDFAAYLLYLRSEAPEGGQRIDPLVQPVEYAPGLIGDYRWSMVVSQYKGYDVYSHGGLYG